MPEPDRNDLNARLRSDLDHAHLSARLELFVHHYFRSNGWEVHIHPEVAYSSNRPDFLVEKGDAKLLVECRSIFDQPGTAQQDQRLWQLADEAGRKLERAVILNPLSDLPPSIPAKRIRSWIERQKIPDDNPDLMEFDFWDDHQGYHYGVRAILPKLNDEGEGLTGVHGVMSQVQTITTAQQLRVAIQEKASRYGPLGVPYVIAVSAETSFHARLKHEVDALLGDRVYNIPRPGPVIVTVTETRTLNGLFTERQDDAFESPQVSAVLVYRFKWLDAGHEHSMRLYHNPYATRCIEPRCFPGVAQLVRQDGDKMGWINSEPAEY